MIPQTAPRTHPRVPPPSHRHGAPSGPWPFLDIDDEVDPDRIADPNSHLPLSATPCSHLQTTSPPQDFCWCKYPQSLYPNWTRRQQKKSRIAKVVDRDKDGRGNSTGESILRYLDVMEDGRFVDTGERDVDERTLDSV
ncbi:hypothetical protein GALMADRAFT_142267 [Galerina marginata CBS 339.88]|uniref:Uncharacterized protein n=1 Tax=Galerina marginata (strain CBS 339.88) TaxID=685588 RepID=A0A067SST8_GALM3|nr:hypothetical protein GALMADRAFT_142267 [Galerina marginata CBS 339.88]